MQIGNLAGLQTMTPECWMSQAGCSFQCWRLACLQPCSLTARSQRSPATTGTASWTACSAIPLPSICEASCSTDRSIWLASQLCPAVLVAPLQKR